MTIKEMNDKLFKHCRKTRCVDCEIFKSNLDFSNGGQTCIGGENWVVERYYMIVFGNNEQEEVENNKGCESCKHTDKTEEEFPCNACKRDYAYSDERHWKHPDRWEPDEAEAKTDNVNHPAHYQGKYECIDEMIAMFGVEAVKAFCRCNVYKYRYRADKKNGAEDLAKAEWYMDKLMELEGVIDDSF